MKTRIFLLIIATFLGSFVYGAPPAEEGRTIFQTRCAGCHNVNKTLTGPALAGVHERHSLEWIISFIKSSQGMVKSGDKEAVALFEKFNKIPMPDHSDLSDENIKSILEYINAEEKAAASESALPAKPYQPGASALSLKPGDFWYLIALGCAILLLIATIVFALKVKEYKRRHI